MRDPVKSSSGDHEPVRIPVDADRKVSYRGLSVVAFLLLAGVVIYGWSTDFITLEGQWTIYTADCDGGSWQGNRCSGHLKAGSRYRFRALKIHQQVFFWTAGEAGATGRYENCTIQDGRNWTCPPHKDAVLTITRQMAAGNPVRNEGDNAIPFHQVSKLRWEAARRGISMP